MKYTQVFLLTPLACACALAVAQTAVLPTGGVVTRGSGSISSSGSSMTVRQTSDRMVADWQSFSIGAGNSVRFVQPGRESVALNRVLGNDASTIYGSLTANGHVFLQNANGVLFAPGAQVDVGALVATTLNADVGRFMNGQLRLAGHEPGSVRNEGTLRAAPGGYVVLAAPQVSNAGRIVAPGGTAALAAGSAVEIDPTGAGLLSIRVPVAAVAAKLENSGRIVADGGAVALQVAATDAALNTVMQVGGVVRARSIEQRDGQILLSGGSSGVVRVSGTLDASGGSGLDGGTVKVLGERIGLLGSARIDASGDTGGGTVLVGGAYQGRGAEPNAAVTVFGAQASIDVSARGRGDGGTAIVWADGTTHFEGRIAARGGGRGGDGGFAEVSGKQRLDFLGGADLRAPAGRRGTLLLDPTTLIIGATADLNGDGTNGDDLVASPLLETDFPGTNFPSQITADRVATLLATGDVLLQSTFQLSVNAPLTVAAGGAASTLTLNSSTVTVSSPVTLNNSSLVIDTSASFSDSIRINAAVQSLNSVSLVSADIGINAVITAGSVLLNSFGVVNQGAAGGIVASQVDTQTYSEGLMDLNLTSTNNRIGSLTLDVLTANVRVDNPAGTPMSVQGSVAGDLTITASGGLAQAGALTVSADTQITTSGSDAALLTNAGNQFFGPLNFTTGAGDQSAVTKVYDGTTAFAYTQTGSAPGGTITTAPGESLSLSGYTLNADGSFTDKNVGTDKAYTVAASTDVVATGLGGEQYYGLQFAGFTRAAGAGVAASTVTPRAITSTGVTAIDRVYNASPTVQLDTSGAALNNVVAGDTVALTPTGASGTMGDKNVGSNKPVTVTDLTLTLTGADAGNYTVTDASTPTVTITPLQIGAAGATGVNRAYDGTTGVTLDTSAVTLNGVLSGDTVTATGGSGTMADKNAGTAKPVNGGVVTLGGADGANYTAAATGSVTVDIAQRAITSTGVTAIDRVYDASTTVQLDTTGAALNNVIAGDTVALAATGGSGTMADKNVGSNKAVTVANLSLSLTGADAANYAVFDSSSPTVTITPLQIGASGATGVTRVYNGLTGVTLDTSAVTLNGVLSGDTVTATGGSGTMVDKNAGTAKPVSGGVVTLGGADGANYTAVASGAVTVDITPRAITSFGVTAVDRVYDGTNVVALDGSAATLNGTLAGDVVTIGVGATGTMADKNVGSNKPVQVGSVSLAGADAANYSLTDNSNATVNISALTLQASGLRAINRVVNGSTVVELVTDGLTLPGVLAGDSLAVDTSGAVGSVSTPDPGLGKAVTVSGLVLTGADAANYAVSPLAVGADGQGLTVRILTVAQGAFEDVRFTRYLQGLSDAQEPFRRAMAEALAAGFGKENIRKQLSRGLVFETGLAAPAVDNIDTARRPEACTGAGGANAAALGCR